MAQNAPIYDLTLLLDTESDPERRDKIVADVETLIDRHGGSLVGRHDWGVRQTAFEVHTDGINRFRVIKLRPGTPDPPDLRASAVGAEAGAGTEEE
jgi:small subunit ribosomal protein S6